ncbi:MAG: hypothetical protein U1E34_11510 [Amaricoccus sp.]
MAKFEYQTAFNVKKYSNVDDIDESTGTLTTSVLSGYNGSWKISFIGGPFKFPHEDAEGKSLSGPVTGMTFAKGGSVALKITGLKMEFADFDNAGLHHGTIGATQFLFHGNDTILGSKQADTLSGYSGNDKIAGNAGDDALFGGDGKDFITGGGGADSLSGGAGADRFIFTSASESQGRFHDVIEDFSHQDKINLTKIDANAGKKGDQAFSFIGSDKFDHHAGELRFSNKMLSGDVDGDGSADFSVEFANSIHVSATDIWL